MASHDIFISARPKARQNTMCIVMKGIEKFITNIYDARHALLKLTSEPVIADIPKTYFGPFDHERFKNSNIAELIASSMTYNSSMLPIPFPLQVPWSGVPPELSWRSQRSAASPLTASTLHQHNQMISNAPIPSINVNGDLHSSGYSTMLNSDCSMTKIGSSATGSHNSSPESNGYASSRIPEGMRNYEISPQQQMQNVRSGGAANEAMLYQGLDPRMIAGIRAMSISPQAGELRTPTGACEHF